MTHQYSVEMQDYISKRLKTITEQKEKAEKQNDLETTEYCKGQLLELIEIRNYLAENIDLNTQHYF